MKKSMKKTMAVLLASLMLTGMATTALAADTYTVQLAGTETSITTNHEYTVYQLFTGELTEVEVKDADGNVTGTQKILANVKYGTAGLGTTGAEVPSTELDAITNAETYAQGLSEKTLNAYGTLKADNEWKLDNVPAGYYLIVDDTSKTLTDGDTYSKYIVKVVKDLSMAPKSEKVTSDKVEYNDAVQETKLNEAGVGTVVSYKLTGTIAEDANVYDYYYFIMGDKLSSGLTFNDDITVTIDGQPATEDTDYAVYKNADGYTFEVALINAKEHAGKTVVVNYSATLNSSAVAMEAETNTYKVIYSNNPYEDYDGKKNPDTPGKPVPGTPLEGENSIFGKTPEQKTETYTTKLELTKTDENHQPLAGATFKLTSTDANQTVLTNKTYYELDPAGSYYLLKDGTYTDVAPAAATIEYVEIGKGDSKTTAGYILKDGAYVVPEDTKDYVDQTLYKKITNNADYASLNTYAQKTATENASKKAPVEIILTTGADGVLNFEGLGSGTYTLTEVDAPNGYNYADSITFTITFDAENETFTSNNVKVNATNGIFATTVIDESGNTLPETGGIGTTIFYVVGTILALGAGVVLVAKRRMAR